jgi:hypothetical protein
MSGLNTFALSTIPTGMSVSRNDRSINGMEISRSPNNFIPSRIHDNREDISRNYSAEDEKILKNFSEKKVSNDIFGEEIQD